MTEYIIPNDNLEQMVKPLRERIVALEILLQQKDMRVRHLEEQLRERHGVTMRIKKPLTDPKDEQ